jgi:[acyl-carrier-protein] S-malonyltransferase
MTALTVVSGSSSDLATVESVAERSRVMAVRLPLPFNSHHPALAPQADVFMDLIREFPVGHPRIPVYSAVLGRSYRPGDDVHRAIAGCLVRPVRLPDVLRQVGAGGALLFEAGTGRSLVRSARRVLGTVTAYAPLAEPFSWSAAEPTHAVPGRAVPAMTGVRP